MHFVQNWRFALELDHRFKNRSKTWQITGYEHTQQESLYNINITMYSFLHGLIERDCVLKRAFFAYTVRMLELQ